MPTQTSSVTVRMNAGLKKEAEQLFESLGLNFSTAVNMFVRQSVRTKSIPFPIALETPNQETIEAMEESRRIARDPQVKGFKNESELLRELNS